MGTLETIYGIETIVIIGSFLFGLAYLALFRLLMKGWYLLKHPQHQPINHRQSDSPSFCILVVCHNEAEHLPALLHDFQNQEVQPQTFILVDDHSNDGTLEIMTQWQKEMNTPVEVICSKGRGKKQAIEEGLANAKVEWVLTTDADCRVPATWSRKVCDIYERTPFDLLIMPVEMDSGKGVLNSIIRMEFITLVGAGMSLAACGHPIMCNGANMAFSLQGRKAHAHQMHKELLSGDDVFLLHALKKGKGKIYVTAHKDCMVKTAGNATFHDFLHQRARWASKAVYYTDKESIAVACCILGISIWQIILYAISLFHLSAWIWALGLFWGKWICDVLYLHSMRKTFPMPHLIGHSLILSFFYPFYITYSAIAGVMRKKIW